MCFLILSTHWCRCLGLRLTFLNVEARELFRGVLLHTAQAVGSGVAVSMFSSSSRIPCFWAAAEETCRGESRGLPRSGPSLSAKPGSCTNPWHASTFGFLRSRYRVPACASFKEAERLGWKAKSTEHWGIIFVQIFFSHPGKNAT